MGNGSTAENTTAGDSESKRDENENDLVILWTTDEKDVFTKMVFPYAFNSMNNNWWGKVILIVWGPSAKLLSEDSELQKDIGELKDAGVILEACKWCAEQYDAADKLQSLDINVKYMGEPLTKYAHSGKIIMTF